MYKRRRRLRALAIVVLGVALVAAGFAALVLKARSNYIAGQRALAAGQYGLAIQRLSAAEVVGRPYGNAHALLNDAVAMSFAQTEYATVLHGAARPTAASLTLRRAAALFESARYTEAQSLVAGLTSRVPPAAAARLSVTGSAAVAAVLLLVGANQALALGDWRTAGDDAAVVLLRYPRCGPAASLAAEAARRQRAAPLTRHAAALAAAGHWTAARKAARQALRVDPAYPGVAALLARIDATLAHRKAAAKAKAAASTATAPTSTATTAPTPVAPKPTPKPPPPP
jgi:tetratricopeptide (TPR) repeat protein